MCLPPDSYVLDRLEGDVAVLEGQGRTWDVPASALSPDAQPGDTLRWDGTHFHRDTQDTLARKAHIDSAMDRLFGKKDR